MDVCDKVNDDPENGSRNAIRIVSQRLLGHNANQQIYTLVLLSSLAQNCGSKMHREIASKALTTQLLDLGKDRQAHQSVKSKVYSTLETLSKEFKGDPSLRQVEDTLETLKRINPSLVPPQVPQKHQMTDLDRQKEEEELQMVLALSLQESQGTAAPAQTQTAQSQSEPTQPETAATGKTAATVSRVKAIYDLTSEDPGELSFRRGDVITVLESVYRDWWKGSLRGEVGIFPLNYVTPIPDQTPAEIAQEQQDEQKVFDGARDIEKLLSLLTNAQSQPASVNIAENEELQKLYHSTQAIRPKLVKMIEKYAQKRDDLIDLDRKFMNARRTYDTLIDTGLSQIPTSSAGGYGQPYGQPYGQAYSQGYGQDQYHQQGPQQQQPPQGYSQYPPQHSQTPGYANHSSPQVTGQQQPTYPSTEAPVGSQGETPAYPQPASAPVSGYPPSEPSAPTAAQPQAPPQQGYSTQSSYQGSQAPSYQASAPSPQQQWQAPTGAPPSAPQAQPQGSYPNGNYPSAPPPQQGSYAPPPRQDSYAPPPRQDSYASHEGAPAPSAPAPPANYPPQQQRPQESSGYPTPAQAAYYATQQGF